MRIDIHAHYWTYDCLDLPADLVKTDAGTLRGHDAGDGQELDARLPDGPGGGRTCRCSPPRRSCLTLMDRGKAVAAARFVNDQYAALAAAGPSPPPDAAHRRASITELGRAWDELGIEPRQVLPDPGPQELGPLDLARMMPALLAFRG
jgi:6-methylsalicylate decarboxylase